VDAQLFILDVAGGGDVARKGGPGIGRADLLVVNKIDLGEYVDVDVGQMLEDARSARDGRPVLAHSKKLPETERQLCDWVRQLHAAYTSGTHRPQDPGPMAPHFHASGDGGYFHSHEHGHRTHSHR
jgi:urease accessory protein